MSQHQVDATKPADIEACVKAILEKHGRIDTAANCVGSIVLKPAHSTTEDEFSQTLGWHHHVKPPPSPTIQHLSRKTKTSPVQTRCRRCPPPPQPFHALLFV